MNGKPVKDWNPFNYALTMPMLSPTIPEEWEKEFCLEYFREVDYSTEASVILIMSMGYDVLHAREIAEEFKRRGKTVVFGGHSDALSTRYMGEVCDAMLLGTPGRKDMKKLLDDIENGRLLEEYLCGMDLNYPFDYSLLDGMAMKYLPVLSSLGCRNTCEYCCAAALYGGKYRVRHPDFVMTDLQEIRKRSRYAAFLDSNIYNNAAYLRQLCERIIDDRVGLLWGAQATIDIGADAETLDLLYRAGCRVLYIGFETLNQDNLSWLDKPYDIERYERNALRIREAGIHVFGYFILGLDNDSQDTFRTVRSFIRRTRMAVPIINLLIPVPGTETYNRLRREDRILYDEDSFLEDNHRYSVPCNTCYFIPRNFTPKNLERDFFALYRSLCTWPEILRRSLDAPPLLAANILFMNIKMRKEYKSLRSVSE
jgi:radical SAM superfamily enzyme YgiQ (UPF0313 family)